jgi:glycerol-3-phosphate dehydrogenase
LPRPQGGSPTPRRQHSRHTTSEKSDDRACVHRAWEKIIGANAPHRNPRRAPNRFGYAFDVTSESFSANGASAYDGNGTSVDVAIIGGGIAALWILDSLDEAGFSTVLIEPGLLGQGQTLASQGIIHGGLKYTLRGLFHPSAQAVSAMPERWLASLRGERRPNLRGVGVRSPSTWMWRSESLSSQLAMIGARTNLRTRPVEVARDARPAVLASAPGTVYRVDEPVLDTPALIERFRTLHLERMLSAPGLASIALRATRADSRPGPEDGFEVLLDRTRRVRARALVLAAGAWNEPLRAGLGLSPSIMQRRPLHMAILRGALPELHGHCVDGAATRVTITTSTHSDGSTVWQVGGQLAEQGVPLEADALLAKARHELQETLGGYDLSGAEWATYRIDRAELATKGGMRPEDAQCVEDGPTGLLTVWPTKLALAPRAAERVLAALERLRIARTGSTTIEGPRPQVGRPPWETAAWRRLA